MVKILSQSGSSLADIYDVKGSIAGIEQLDTRELGIVHEMGATVFSERFRTGLSRLTTGAILQNLDFNVGIATSANVWRFLGVLVLADVAGRVDFAQVSMRNTELGREMPVFIWDQNDGGSLTANIRIVENTVEANIVTLIPSHSQMPNLAVGNEQPSRARGATDIVLRGRTAAFGVGTVTITLVTLIAFAEPGGLSSRGLPVPSW